MASPILTTGFVDYRGKLIAEGTRLYVQAWGYYLPDGIYSHYLWRIGRSRAGNLVLVAEGGKKRLPLTMERLNKLVVYTPAPGLGLADFPEEWSWWRAHGWGVVLRQTLQMLNEEEPGMELQAYAGSRLRGMHWDGASWRLLQQHPKALQRQLGEILYFVLHPRKAKKLGGLCEEHIPDEIYQPFVARMRRKAKRLGYS